MLEDHSPGARWRVDTLLSMLGIAGAACDRSIPAAAVVYVSQNEELHAHAAHKTFRMMKVNHFLFFSSVFGGVASPPRGEGRGMEGRGRTHLLLALVIWPLTTHPFRDGAPFLLLRETPPTFGVCYASSVYYIQIVCLSYTSPVSPSAATIYLVG